MRTRWPAREGPHSWTGRCSLKRGKRTTAPGNMGLGTVVDGANRARVFPEG
jgi:hypothetical protein